MNSREHLNHSLKVYKLVIFDIKLVECGCQENIETLNGLETCKRYMLPCATIEDSDQPARPRSLIRVFDGRSMGSQVSKVSSGRKLRP